MVNSKRLPRGLRNSNPLNIRHSKGYDWQGEVGQDADGFCIFLDNAWGYRAAFRVLRTYNDRHHIYSVREIIRRWAPSKENDTKSYIARVCNITGLKPQDNIVAESVNPEDRMDAIRLVRAMAMVENGCGEDMLPVEEIERGRYLAFGPPAPKGGMMYDVR